jgi:hypothetical protein
MAKFIPKILTPFLTYDPSDGVNEAVSYASKAARLLIIASRFVPRHSPIPHRYKHHIKGKSSNDKDMLGNDSGLELIPPKEPVVVVKKREEKDYVKEIDKQTKNNTENIKLSKRLNTSGIVREGITICDIDWEPTSENQSTEKYYKSLELPFVPDSLDFNPDSSWVAIATMARNNPHYHYTGSEDTLEFTIDWFTSDDLRRDVIYNCRWLESLSKGDGYNGRPHRVKLVWGADGTLFLDDVWVVVKAPYKLQNFNRGFLYTEKQEGVYGTKYSYDLTKKAEAQFKNTHMLPQQAYQTVTLKRITQTNMTRYEIIRDVNTVFSDYKNGG